MANHPEAATTGDLKLSSITKSFGDFLAVDDLDLVIPKGSFFALWAIRLRKDHNFANDCRARGTNFRKNLLR